MYKPPTSKWIVEFAKTVAIMVESAPTIWQWSCVSVSVCTLPLHLCLYMRINILMWILFSLFIRNGSEKECLQKTREFIRNWNCVCSHWNRQGAHVSYPWFISFSFPFSRLYFYIYTIFFLFILFCFCSLFFVPSCCWWFSLIFLWSVRSVVSVQWTWWKTMSDAAWLTSAT